MNCAILMYLYENKLVDDNLTMTLADMTKYLIKDVCDIDSMEGNNSIFLKIYMTYHCFIFLDKTHIL